MEAYGDHRNAPDLRCHQERQNIMLYLMNSLNDGGPSLTPILGNKNISYTVIKDESRMYQYGWWSDDDRGWSERLR
eukprot:7682381-Heterocapsa_arctica.AAC.1